MSRDICEYFTGICGSYAREICHFTGKITQVIFPNTETNMGGVNGFYCQKCAFN